MSELKGIGTLVGLFGLLSALSAPAATPLSKVRYAPDVTTVLSGVTIGPAGPAEDDLAGLVTSPSIGTIPAGARLDGYALHPNGFQYLSFDTAVTLSGTTFLRNDVVQYDGAGYTLYFSS
ncbi:MAG TPA: hypothetical protein VGR00_01470, partial [Thermoanaerobaculia bacterium]|nr:hypothetical protein [Thermoanaerobaculia bacterium]